MSPDRAEAIWHAFTNLEDTAGIRMITPGVLEIIAIPAALALAFLGP